MFLTLVFFSLSLPLSLKPMEKKRTWVRIKRGGVIGIENTKEMYLFIYLFEKYYFPCIRFALRKVILCCTLLLISRFN